MNSCGLLDPYRISSADPSTTWVHLRGCCYIISAGEEKIKVYLAVCFLAISMTSMVLRWMSS